MSNECGECSGKDGSCRNDQARQPEVFEELAGHRPAIRRHILAIVKDPAEAEDLTQDTLLRARDNADTLRDRARLLPWLYRIATNICYDRFRQASYRKRGHSLEGGDDGDGGIDLADDSPRLDKVLEQQEMSACVQSYVTELPDSYRAVIMLHDMEGLTNPEIAEMLDTPLSTVKIRLHRARLKLREVLGQACTFSVDERGVRVCEPKPPEPSD